MSDLLAGFIPAKQLAKDLKRTERTLRNWMAAPNGLPYTELGHQRLIHLETAREWLLSRMRQQNPDRRRRKRER
jgi:hypothetical protein